MNQNSRQGYYLVVAGLLHIAHTLSACGLHGAKVFFTSKAAGVTSQGPDESAFIRSRPAADTQLSGKVSGRS